MFSGRLVCYRELWCKEMVKSCGSSQGYTIYISTNFCFLQVELAHQTEGYLEVCAIDIIIVLLFISMDLTPYHKLDCFIKLWTEIEFINTSYSIDLCYL